MTRLEHAQRSDAIFEKLFWPYPHIALNLTRLKEIYDEQEEKQLTSLVDLLRWVLEEVD